MKLGLLADVRGLLAPLESALNLLQAEGCDRIACLGSTAEGGDEDGAVLDALAAADVAILPSPHDVADAVTEKPAEIEVGGLRLAHATPEDMPLTETLWATGAEIPMLPVVAERLRAAPQPRACGDWFDALACIVPDAGEPRRRHFIRSGRLEVPPGPFVACPGSVAMADRWRRGGSVMTWDQESRELTALRFTSAGPVEESPVRVLVYCEDFEPHRPAPELLDGVELTVHASADEIVAEVASVEPDFVLLDYHLDGSMSGLDALLALRPGGAELPVPVFTISGNPADQARMKDAGALGGLPFSYLRDVLERLLREVAGAAPPGS